MRTLSKFLLLFALLLLVPACGRQQSESLLLPEAPPAQGSASALTEEERHLSQLHDLYAQYEAEGWVAMEGESCAHGGAFRYNDVRYQRTGPEGEESVWICAYRLRELSPEAADTPVPPCSKGSR